MFKPSIKFALAPIERRDTSTLLVQWRAILLVLTKTYFDLGLIPESTEIHGIHRLVRLSWRGWWRKWSPSIIAGWTGSGGEGFYSQIGGIFLAIWDGRRECVRDLCAVGIGSCMLGALWCAGACLVMFGLTGTAHAATAGSVDLAQQILGDLFPFLGQGTALAIGLEQIALSLSLMALGLAVIMIIWTSVWLLVEFVDDDDGFEKRYSVPMFIGRVVIAAGLLVPLPGGYYSGVQRIVGFLGLWGSNQATSAWNSMVSNMNNSAMCASGQQTGASCSLVGAPMISEADLHASVIELIKAETCMAAITQDPARNSVENVVFDGTNYNYQQSLGALGWVTTQTGACGKVSFAQPSTTGVQSVGSDTASAIVKAEQTAFTNLQQQIRTEMQTIAANHVQCRDTPTCPQDPPDTDVANWINSYRTALQNGVQSAMGNANQAVTQNLSSSATSQGWIGAGAYAMQLSLLQSSIDGAADSIPRLSPPQAPRVEPLLEAATQKAINGIVQSGSPMSNFLTANLTGVARKADVAFRAVVNWGGNMSAAVSDAVSTATNLSTYFPQIDSMAPLAGMSYLGRWTYWAALSMKGVEKLGSLVPIVAGGVQGAAGTAAGPGGTAVGAVTGVIEGSILHKVGQELGDLIDAVFYPMLFTGLALAYFVPSLPFLRFLFGVLGWMLAFVECVFLVPVLLVLTISAEKGPFFNPAAKAALWNVAALVVRPLFTLAGFVVGLMVITETIGILNSVMVTMIRSNSATGSSTIVSVFAFVSYVIVYLGTAYVIVNTATKAAEVLPHSVYRWMGANAGGERDDAGGIAGALGAATGNFRHALQRPKKS